jgi:hypothetical protein
MRHCPSVMGSSNTQRNKHIMGNNTVKIKHRPTPVAIETFRRKKGTGTLLVYRGINFFIFHMF